MTKKLPLIAFNSGGAVPFKMAESLKARRTAPTIAVKRGGVMEAVPNPEYRGNDRRLVAALDALQELVDLHAEIFDHTPASFNKRLVGVVRRAHKVLKGGAK